MQFTKLIWRDGQPYSDLFDDIYYSSDENEGIPGQSEFDHVFFKHNGLPERWLHSDEFVVAELGFGSGLNCLLTIREWLKHCAGAETAKTLHYIAIEKHPLSAATIDELISPYPELKPLCNELLESYPPAVEARHIRRLFDGRVVIHYRFMDVYDALDDDCLDVDAWYLDGFSPAKNPEMWSEQLFKRIAKNSGAGATCSTYTAAGFVRRNLQKAGFMVNKVGGYGKKREMLVAELPAAELDNKTPADLRYKDKPWFERPAKKAVSNKAATVIGAGIAGLSLAYALVQRGWMVTIIDKHGDNEKEASSNPAPIVYPRLSINNDIDTNFFITAYCYALHIFNALQKKNQQRFWFGDGILQLMDEKRITQIINKFQLNNDFISIADEVVSVAKKEQVTVNYATSGVVLPGILCEVLKKECGEKLNIIDAEISKINYDGKTWQCLASSGLIKETEILIVANGTEVNNLGLPLTYPVEIIRGQVVVLNENKASQQIKKTLNADIHITPAINSKHYLGATYVKGCDRLEVCHKNSGELMISLNKIYPDVFKEDDYCDSWVGFRIVSKDRTPIVGAVPDVSFFNKEYADIRHGSTTKKYQPARYLKGLYVSAAHGSRGFTSSFISAEIIVSQITGEPPPVNKKILDYLNPSRFIVNNLKRG